MESTNKRRCTVGVLVQLDWSTLPQELFPLIVSHWDVATLVKKKQVCRDWNQLCTNLINAKQTKTTKRAFATNQELKDAIKKYCGNHGHRYKFLQRCSPEKAEEFAISHNLWTAHQQMGCIQGSRPFRNL
jgi:hypothetical protein